MHKIYCFVICFICFSGFILGQKPIITQQPANTSTCDGGTISFSVLSNAIHYQWKESKDGIVFNNLTDGYLYSGTSTSTLTISGINSLYNNYSYVCIVKDATGAFSDSTTPAVVSISPLSSPIHDSIDICDGTSTTLFATPTLVPAYNYEWKVPPGFPLPGNVNTITTSFPGDYMVNVFSPSTVNLICNADFEIPVIGNSYSNVDTSNFSCWKNSAQSIIEVWKSGFNGVPAHHGNQFIEINASSAGTLYTNLSNLTQGTVLTISFAHRGRSGTDVMKVLFGPPFPAPNSNCVDLGNFATSNSAWVVYTLNYIVPSSGNYTLRFQSVSSANGSNSYGNFIDNIIINQGSSTCAILSKEFTINKIQQPTATIFGDTNVCQNDPSPKITLKGQNGQTPYQFTFNVNNGVNNTINSNGDTVNIIVPTTNPGIKQYNLVNVIEGSSAHCTQNQPGSAVVTIVPSTQPGTISSDQTICYGSNPDPLHLVGNVGNVLKWQYSVAPFTTWLDIPNSTNLSFSPSGLTETTKFRAEVQNDICPKKTTNTITINVSPTSIGGQVNSDQTLCQTTIPTQLNLSNQLGNILKWQYTVSPFTTWIDTTITTVNLLPPQSTKTTKYRAWVKSGVCPQEVSSEATISIIPLEKLNLNCGSSSVDSVRFTWTDISDESAYNFSYSIQGQSVVNGQVNQQTTSFEVPVNIGNATGVKLTLIPLNAGCSQADTITCFSKPCTWPQVDQLNDTMVCGPQNFTFPVFSSQQQTDSLVWTINQTNLSWINPSGVGNIPTLAIPNTSGQVALIFTVNALKDGCKGPDMNFNFIINPLPNFIPSADYHCENDSLNLIVNYSGATSVVWSGPNNFNHASTGDGKVMVTPHAMLSNNGTYTVEVTDLNACKNNKTIDINIHALPSITAGNDKIICQGDTIVLNGGGADSLSWSQGIINNTPFVPTTTMVYTVTGVDIVGCKNFDEVQVTVNSLPSFQLAVNEPCEEKDLLFNVTLSPVLTGLGVQSTNWSGPLGFTSSALNPLISSVTIGSTGTYTLLLTDNNNCTLAQSIAAVVNPIDDIQIENLVPKCLNDSPFLLPTPSILGGTWSSNDNTSIVNQSNGLFDPSKSKPNQENKVTVTYTTETILPARKCPNTISIVQLVNPVPNAEFLALDTVLCLDEALQLELKEVNPQAVYMWDFGDGHQLSGQSPINYLYQSEGNYTISLTANLDNCFSTNSIIEYIDVIALPTNVYFTQSNYEVDYINPEILFFSSTNAIYYAWDFGDGTSSNFQNPKHTFPEKPGEYTIVLTVSNLPDQCTASYSSTLIMNEPVVYFLPNTFTPNGDERNNVFQPIFTSGFDPQQFSFYVFNRWGTLLFESHDAKIGWDGTFNNTLVQNDTYIWKLEFADKNNGQKCIKTGHLNLLK